MLSRLAVCKHASQVALDCEEDRDGSAESILIAVGDAVATRSLRIWSGQEYNDAEDIDNAKGISRLAHRTFGRQLMIGYVGSDLEGLPLRRQDGDCCLVVPFLGLRTMRNYRSGPA